MARKRINELYDEYARTLDRSDLLGQVRRTVNGRPVGAEQVRMMVDAVRTHLDLQLTDVVLDLCCGNGLLTQEIFSRCAGGVGVDMGEYLISVARENFDSDNAEYCVSDVADYCENASSPERFTKALCYGSFAYLSDEVAVTVLRSLSARFTRIERVVLGNIPDRSKAMTFFRPESYYAGIEDDNESVIGRWRAREDVDSLARTAGWTCSFHAMPADYYGASYRFDAILTRLQ